MAVNEIKLKISIDGKDANATIDLTDDNIKQLYQSFKYGKQEVNGLTTAISQGFNNAREIIQGAREAFNVLASAFSSQLNAYQEQEAALIKLNTALKQSGQYTDANVKSLTDYASELQQITIYGDEVTETVMAQLLAMGLNIEQTKQATMLAADLATIMGTDLNSAARVMGDLFAGNATMINRYVKGLDESILKSGDLNQIMAMLNERIGGQATAMGESATGAIAKMNNAIGDLKENAGELLSKALSPIIKIIADLFAEINRLSPTLSGLIGVVGSLTVALVTLQVTGIGGVVKSIFTDLIPAITAATTKFFAMQTMLGSAGWLTLGFAAVAGAVFLLTEEINSNAAAIAAHRRSVDAAYPDWDKSGLGPRNQADVTNKQKGDIGLSWLSKFKKDIDDNSAANKKYGMTVDEVREKIKRLTDEQGKLIVGSEAYYKNLAEIERLNKLLQPRQKKGETEKPEIPTIESEFELPEPELLGDIQYGNTLDYARLSKQEELDIWYESEIEKVSMYENSTEMLLALSEEYNRRKAELDEETANTALSVYSEMFGTLSMMFGKHTLAYKMFAITQTIIDTYQAAQSAYKSMVGIPVVGPGLAAIAATTAILQGMARVKAIEETKVPGYAQGGAIVGEKGIEIITPAKDYAKGFAEVALMTKAAIMQSSNSDYSALMDRLDQWQSELTLRFDGYDFVAGIEKIKDHKSRLSY